MPSKKVKDPETGKAVTIVESKKRVAADGTQRGLKRKSKTNKRDQLMADCQRLVHEMTGINDWDPVVLMAVVSARAFSGYPAVDEDGQPIIDQESGKQVMVPPDPQLAVSAAAKAAPYLHQHLKPREVGDEDDTERDPEEKRDKILSAFENMGVKVVRNEE